MVSICQLCKEVQWWRFWEQSPMLDGLVGDSATLFTMLTGE